VERKMEKVTSLEEYKQKKHDSHVEDIGKLKLDGVNVDEGLKEIANAYKIFYDTTSDTAVPKDHPVIERQRRIAKNVDSLEGIVKGELEDSLKASKAQAEGMAKKMAYELAKATDGYKGEIKDFDHEKVVKYLTEAAQATGNPAIGNWVGFIESIMNLPAAKPGDPLYQRDSALAQLINYISTQKDTESRRLRYLQNRVAELWEKPEYGIKLQGRFGEQMGIPLGPTATARDAFGEVETRATLKAQEHAQTTTGKTYLKKPAEQYKLAA